MNLFFFRTLVLLGNGAGGFAPAVKFAEGDQSFALTAGDFNRDGRLDLATANVDSDNVFGAAQHLRRRVTERVPAARRGPEGAAACGQVNRPVVRRAAT